MDLSMWHEKHAVNQDAFILKGGKGMNVKYDFSGKTAVVTGAASGIGEGIALAFAESGASVAILDINMEKGQETAAACEKLGVKAKAFHQRGIPAIGAGRGAGNFRHGRLPDQPCGCGQGPRLKDEPVHTAYQKSSSGTLGDSDEL